MTKKRIFNEPELAGLAKEFRCKAGIKKAETARQFRVNRATVQQAEEYPKISLTKLRVRIIEAYSAFEVIGPLYLLRKKKADPNAPRLSAQTTRPRKHSSSRPQPALHNP